MNLVLVGHGWYVEEVAEVAAALGSGYGPVGQVFVATDRWHPEEWLAGRDELKRAESIMAAVHLGPMTCAVRTSVARRELVELAVGLGAVTAAPLVHAGARADGDGALESGAVLMCGASLAVGVRIGEHSHIGRAASIGQNTAVGPFATIHAGAAIGRDCRIDEEATVGPSARVLDGVTVGRGAVVAEGVIVTADLAPLSMLRRSGLLARVRAQSRDLAPQAGFRVVSRRGLHPGARNRLIMSDQHAASSTVRRQDRSDEEQLDQEPGSADLRRPGGATNLSVNGVPPRSAR